MPSRPRLTFLLSRRRREAGSALMRGPQLRALVQPFLPPDHDTRVAVLPSPRFPLLQALWARAQQAETIFFVTKPAIKRLLPETAHLLQRNGCRLCFDHVDAPLVPGTVQPDAHIASSYAQARSLTALQTNGTLPPAPVLTILHNADARLYALGPMPTRLAFRAAYFGLPELTHIPPSLVTEITILSANGQDKVDQALSFLPSFPLHYACRSDMGAPVVKPFTKGVTAAILGANVLTGRDVPDAVEMLGADYPYLTGPTEREITETFARARYDFGGPDWTNALTTMKAVAELVSPQSLALQVGKLVAELES